MRLLSCIRSLCAFTLAAGAANALILDLRSLEIDFTYIQHAAASRT